MFPGDLHRPPGVRVAAIRLPGVQAVVTALPGVRVVPPRGTVNRPTRR